MCNTGYRPPQSAEELLRRYAEGERFFAGADLDQTTYDLRGVTLEGADLSRSFILADFRGANLRGVKFEEANIKTCDFREADLEGASFRGACLEATAFKGAELRGSDFTGATCYSFPFSEGEKPDW
jgi:uncharacterized protein YjbI with pentapeptide repeats